MSSKTQGRAGGGQRRKTLCVANGSDDLIPRVRSDIAANAGKIIWGLPKLRLMIIRGAGDLLICVVSWA